MAHLKMEDAPVAVCDDAKQIAETGMAMASTRLQNMMINAFEVVQHEMLLSFMEISKQMRDKLSEQESPK